MSEGTPVHTLDTIVDGAKYYTENEILCIKRGVRKNTLRQLTTLLAKQKTHNDSREKGRSTMCIASSSDEAKLLYGDKRLRQLFHALHGFELQPSEFPIEYRVYAEGSKEWIGTRTYR